MEWLSRVTNAYHVFNEEWGDPRNRDLWLMRSPALVLALAAGYVCAAWPLGTRLMRNRQPLPVERLIQAYNLAQIAVNLYIFKQALVLGWATTYSWRCEPLDSSWSPTAVEIASSVHLFFIVKCSDLLDTAFFVLRKKNKHISFLHVYHHCGMFLGSWAAAKFFPGGHITFLGFVNSFVHTVMYSYYLFTSLYPQLKVSIWWKKHITQLQMMQFFMILVHSGQLFFDNFCNYPMTLVCFLAPQNAFMIILFWNFYRRAYLTKKNE